MTAYNASFTWTLLDELFQFYPESLIEVIGDESGEELRSYIRNRLELTSVELDYSLEVLERMAYEVTQTVDDDFNRLLYTVKNSTGIIREIFTPKDARVLIDSFEKSSTPALTLPELVTGIYLVLKGGERDIPKFDVLNALVELETL